MIKETSKRGSEGGEESARATPLLGGHDATDSNNSNGGDDDGRTASDLLKEASMLLGDDDDETGGSERGASGENTTARRTPPAPLPIAEMEGSNRESGSGSSAALMKDISKRRMGPNYLKRGGGGYVDKRTTPLLSGGESEATTMAKQTPLISNRMESNNSGSSISGNNGWRRVSVQKPTEETSTRGGVGVGETSARRTPPVPLFGDKRRSPAVSTKGSSRRGVLVGGGGATSASDRRTPLLGIDTERSNDQNGRRSDSPVNGTTTSAVAMDIEDGEYQEVRERKKGHRFFLICCDTKRAVLYLNSAVFLLNIFTLAVAISKAVSSDFSMTEDFRKAIIIRTCGLFVMFAAILGAYWYSKTLVTVGLLFTCYQLTMATIGIVRYDWKEGGSNESGKLEVLLPAVWYTLMFYAEVAFVSEVHSGIMSHETYRRREKYSCCCTC